MVLLLGIIVATFLTTHQLIKHNRWVDHSYEVNNNLENIYSNTNAIVASLRGYLLTGNPSFESSLKRYESKLMQHYDQALMLTTDNAKQQVRLKQLKPLLDERLNLAKETIKLRREHGLIVAVAAVNTLSGEELTNQIRQRVSALQNEEKSLLIKRQQDAEQSSNRMYFILSIGALSGLSLLLFLFVSLRKQLTQSESDALLLKKYEAIVESSSDAIISKSLQGIIQSWNKGAENIFGYMSNEAIGHPMQMLIPTIRLNEEPEILRRIANGEKVEHFETERLHKNGHLIAISATISPIVDDQGKVIGASKIARDISERKLAEAEIKKLAFYDTLTKLPNRRLLNERLSQTIATSKRTGRYGALMFLDLDNFKPLNDTHGHDVGDMLLIEVANRLTRCIREVDTVARFGGDEFVVMLSELDADKVVSTTQTTVVAEKIRVVLSEPYVFTVSHIGQADITVEHRCTATIGVIVFNGSEGSPDDIMKWADLAMYEAKDAGRNQIKFYGEQAQKTVL